MARTRPRPRTRKSAEPSDESREPMDDATVAACESVFRSLRTIAARPAAFSAGELAVIARGPGAPVQWRDAGGWHAGTLAGAGDEQSVDVVTADDGPDYTAGQIRHVFPGAIR